MKNELNKKRRSRYKRDPNNKRPGRFQPDGDGKILYLIHEYRYLTRPLLELLTGRKGTPIKNRLQFLWHENYIDKVQFPKNYFVKGSTPDIYILGKEGEKFYKEATGEKPRNTPKWNQNRDPQLEHTLLINTIRAMVTNACNNNHDLKLIKWIRSGENCKDQVMIDGKEKIISPDGFFMIKKPGGRVAPFFLEADRSTMDTPTFTEKLKRYYAYYRSIRSELNRRKKQTQTEKGMSNRFNIQGFRVLTVIENDHDWQKLRSRDRLQDLVQKGYEASNKKGFGGFWFTTKSRFDTNNPESILENIWEVSHPAEERKFHSILE